MKKYINTENPEIVLEGREASGIVSPKIPGEPRGLFVKNEDWEQLFEDCRPGEKVTIIILRNHD